MESRRRRWPRPDALVTLVQRVLREEAAEHEAGVEEVRRGKVDEEGEEFLGESWPLGPENVGIKNSGLPPRIEHLNRNILACVLQAISHTQTRIVDDCYAFPGFHHCNFRDQFP